MFWIAQRNSVGFSDRPFALQDVTRELSDSSNSKNARIIRSYVDWKTNGQGTSHTYIMDAKRAYSSSTRINSSGDGRMALNKDCTGRGVAYL